MIRLGDRSTHEASQCGLSMLNFGIKIAEGIPAEIVRNPQVMEAYLGKDEDAA